MNIVIRADASVAIGSGHVARCLALADELRRRGGSVWFACRDVPGNMMDAIGRRGFAVVRLTGPQTGCGPHEEDGPASTLHDWRQDDADQTGAAIERHGIAPDWLIVDHYGLSMPWEVRLRGHVHRLMVIDDLADRPHECDLLLDQNFDNARHERYRSLTPRTARHLLGTQFALLRPEFREHREKALAKRRRRIERLLITMGGADLANDTAKALIGLLESSRSRLEVDVIIGGQNPHGAEIRRLCDALPRSTLHVQTSRMAELMIEADVAIGACGSTTWERCALGLPALCIIQSEDQAEIAAAVAATGAHKLLGHAKQLGAADYCRAIDELDPDLLSLMSKRASELCDGHGTCRVAMHLESWRD